MSTKQKILAALDISLGEIAESRLLDILLDSYAARQKRINELEMANAREREELRASLQHMQAEYQRMRNDPLYCVRESYFFEIDAKTFLKIDVQGSRIDAFKCQDGISYILPRASPVDVLGRKL